MSAEAHVRLAIADSIATVTLDRPDRRNALTVDMRTRIAELFEGFASDDTVRAVVLAGSGEHFCVGGDVAAMDTTDEATSRARIRAGAHRLIKAIHGLEKPVVAAVNGVAAGIGWSMAMACDFIWVAPDARFSQAFTRIGLAPDGGSAYFLARRVALPLAKELAFSARVVAADEAYALGLIDQIAPEDQLAGASRTAAAQFAQGPTRAFGLTKRLFNASLSPSLDDFLDAEIEVQPALRQTSDHQEGLAAFRDKRPPVFVGR